MAEKRERDEDERKQNGDAAARQSAPRQTRFVFKLMGLLLVGLAGWLGWYAYRKGELPDLTNPEQQRRLLAQAHEDLKDAEQKAVETSRAVVNWAERSLEDLKTRIKGKPPESKEEVAALVTESERDAVKAPPPAAAPSRAEVLMLEAREAYNQGRAAHARTNPVTASQAQVQENLRIAGPHFSRCMDLVEEARKLGHVDSEMESLEHLAASRLFDCLKRTELKR